MEKGIWISQSLIDEDISWMKKALLSEISQLEELEHGCIASNAHFSNKLRISKQGISKALNELHKDGYIHIDNSQSKRNFGRKLTINFSKSAINFSKSGVHQSGESKGKKPIKKPNKYESFIMELKSKASIPSKVTSTKDGKKLFDNIKDKDKLIGDYLRHQLEKKDFAQRITAFMEDYKPTNTQQSKMIIGGMAV